MTHMAQILQGSVRGAQDRKREKNTTGGTQTHDSNLCPTTTALNSFASRAQANLTSTWGAIRSPPTGGGSASDLPFSPTLSCDDDESGNEEPVLSGFGAVSKDCCTSGLLANILGVLSYANLELYFGLLC